MAAGDLITRDGQYEFNNLLLNDGASGNLQVLKCTGLFDLPDVKVTEFEGQDDDGGFTGIPLLSMRRVAMDLAIRGGTELTIHQKIEQLKNAFQPSILELPLVFQRPHIGKRQLMARVRKLGGFDTSYEMAIGAFVMGSVLFVASDPRVISLPLAGMVVTIPASNTNGSATANQVGYFSKGAWPILSIAGPATNPRIQNLAEGNRSMKFDLVINAGETFVVDVKNRTVTKNGVDAYSSVRDDNQWWRLLPGANLITYSRSNTPATASALTITWGHTYL